LNEHASFIADIRARVNDFMASVRKVTAEAQRLPNEITIDIEADIAAATAQLERMKSEMRSIPNTIKSKMDFDLGKARIELASIEASIRSLDGKSIDVNVDTDVAKAKADINSIKRELTIMSIKSKAIKIAVDAQNAIKEMGTLRAALLALAPAAIPIIASIVPAIMALGNAIAVVGGGVIGLAGAIAIAGTGVMVFGAMAMSAYKMLQDGTIQATAQTRAFQTALASLQTQWQSLVQTNSGAIFTTMTNGINIAKTALSGLTPFITGVANSMSTLSTKMLDFFKNSSIANNFFAMFNTIGVSAFTNVMNAAGQFGAGLMAIFTQFGPLFSWMAQGLANMSAQFQAWANSIGTSNGIKTFIEYTKTNLPVIGQIFGDTFMGIFNLFKAFGTNSQTIFQALAEMTAKFRAWSETVGQTNGFKQFIDYVQTQGPVVISAIGSIVNALVAFGTAMAPIGAAVLGMVTSFTQWITSMMQVHPVITMVIGAVVAFIGIAAQIVGVLTKVWTAVQFVVGIFGGWSAIMTAVGAAVGFLLTPLGALIAVAAAVGAAIYLLWTRCEAFRNGVMILVGVMQTLGSVIMSALGTALSYIGTQLTLVIAQVVAFGSQLISSISTAMANVGNAISTGIATAVSFFSSGFSNMLSIASSIMSSISSAVSSAWNAITSAISSAISTVVSVVSSGFSNMLSVASSIMSSIVSTVSSAFSAVVSAISSGISSAVSAVTSGFSAMMSAVSSFVSSMVSAITSGMASFVSAISSGASQALSAITSMVSGILSAVRGAAGQMVSAGADLVRGFINGIQSMAGAALDAARSMAQNAVNAVRSALKIGSPSKVLKQIGQWMTQGFALGIEKDIPKVQTAVDRMLRPVRKGLARLKTANYSDAKDGASSVYSLMINNMKEATKKIEEIADKRKSLMEKIKKTQQELFKVKTVKGKLTKSNELAKLKAQFAQMTKQAKKMYKVRKVNRDLKYEIRPMLIYMARLAKKREQIAAKLDKAKDKLQAAIDKRTDFRNMIRDDLRGYASITNTGRRTSQGMVKMMTKRLAEIKKYQALIGSLKKRGLNKTTLQEILDAGIEQGSVIAKGLFAGGQQAIKQVNSLQSQINKASANMATSNADHFYKAGVDAAKGVVKGLQAQDKALKSIAEKLANTISATIKKRLKIRSPSRVMMNLMAYVGSGLVNGLIAAKSVVANASAKLSDAIERNVKPDIALAPFDLNGGMGDMKRTVAQSLDANIENGVEIPKQNITIVVRSEHDLVGLTHAIDQVKGADAALSYVG